MRNGIALPLIVLTLSTAAVNADLLKTPGTAGVPFLKIGTTARPESMSGMFSGMADDVSAIEYNPAGLAQLRKSEVSLTHIIWFNDITLDSLLFGYRNGRSVYAFGGTFLRAVDYVRTKVDDYATDTSAILAGAEISQQNVLGTFSYSYDSGDTNYGVSAKYISQQLYGKGSASYAADMGILFKSADKRTGYGVTLQNLGPAIGADALPAAARLGIGHREDGFNVTLDAVQFIDSKTKLGAGIEIFFGSFLAMRGGLYSQGDVNFTGGLGFNFGAVKIDYAYLPNALLGQAHRVSMLIGFGAGAPPVSRPEKTSAAQPAVKVTLAVVDFAAKDVPEPDAINVSDLLTAELANTWKFNVVDRQKVASGACAESACAVKAGKVLNAQKVIFGTFSKYGDKSVIVANMVDTATGEVTKSFGQEVPPAGVRDACKILALKFSLQ